MHGGGRGHCAFAATARTKENQKECSNLDSSSQATPTQTVKAGR